MKSMAAAAGRWLLGQVVSKSATGMAVKLMSELLDRVWHAL
jgi:hypothetical protein